MTQKNILIKIIAFGITKEIIGGISTELSIEESATVGDLKTLLHQKYPQLKKLRSLQIAVNQSYQKNDFKISEQDEIVLIPPVSGG